MIRLPVRWFAGRSFASLAFRVVALSGVFLAGLWWGSGGDRALQPRSLVAAVASSQKVPNGKPVAVVLDLDETVLDNSRFQAGLILADATFNDQRWAGWVRKHVEEIDLVPGARGFILTLAEKGVAIVYISNRPDDERAGTEATLKRLGVAVHRPEDLLLQVEPGDKLARRQAVEARYDVIAWLGDSLTDFPGGFEHGLDLKTATAEQKERAQTRRKDLVRDHATRFGDDWFVLPNPVYGDWRRLVDPSHLERSLDLPSSDSEVAKWPTDPPPAQRQTPATDLTALLWVQRSGEYEAVCRQTYHLARLRIEQKLAQRGALLKAAR